MPLRARRRRDRGAHFAPTNDAHDDDCAGALGGDAHHDHGESLRQRLFHLVVPGGHAHGGGHGVEGLLETSGEGLRTVRLSVLVLGLTAVVQVAVVAASGSVALLGDSLHNVADALTAAPLAVAFVLGRRPPSARYTYGYGRAEDLAGIAVVVAIAASAALSAWATIDRLFDPAPVDHLGAVIAAGLIGCAGNELVARHRIRVGTRIGSAALVADGLHARSDSCTSLALVAGGTGVAAGWPLADPLAGLLITVAIGAVLWGAARSVLHRLMDAVDPEIVDLAHEVLRQVEGVQRVERVRLRWIGHCLQVDGEIAVDAGLLVGESHLIVEAARRALEQRLPRLTNATLHTLPGAVRERSAKDLAVATT
jgi:cation diffusion facilitator family transporter